MNKILSVILAALVALALGCGKSETFQSPDGQMKVEQKGDATKLEVVTKEGKAAFAASDSEVAIPDTFPKDVPILKGAVAKMSMSQDKAEILHLHLPGSIADVAKEYQDKLKAEGWEIQSTTSMGEGSMVYAKKGNRECTAMVMKDDPDGTLVQLAVSQE